MSRTLYDIYQKNVFVLAKTLVIKHDAIAQNINDDLFISTDGSYVASDNRLTWKYYMNMSGQYHSTDIMALKAAQGQDKGHMIITIASDNGPIEAAFTRELLEDRPTLANEYVFDSYLYRQIVAKYPQYEQLIFHIVNPIDINLAISAGDGQVLYFGGYYYTGLESGYGFSLPKFVKGQTLLEPQETNIIIQMQKRIDDFFYRWFNKDYLITDNRYLTVKWAILFAFIPNFIMNLRLANCRTPQAHSYHIKEYLESHGKLAKYADALSTKQLLWLYRDLIWLESEHGKQLAFDSIVENLFNPSGIPLAEYTIQHDLSDIAEDIQPAVTMRRNFINFDSVGSGATARTVYNVLEDQIGLGRDNGRDLATTAAQITSKISSSKFDSLPTKVLESKVVDYIDYSPFPISDVIFNLWVYLIANNAYDGLVTVTHPLTGERLIITPKTAFITALYSYNLSLSDIVLDVIPTVSASLIPRLANFDFSEDLGRLETIPQIKKKINMDNITDGDMISLRGDIDTSDYQDAHEAIVATLGATDPVGFFERCNEVQKELMRRYYIYTSKEDMFARGWLEVAASRYYWSEIPCVINPEGLTFDEFFLVQGIDLEGMSRADHLTLADEIFQKIAPDPNRSKTSLKRLQEAMIGILNSFKSYTTHVIQSINSGAVVMIDGSALRTSNIIETIIPKSLAQIEIKLDYNIQMTGGGKYFIDVVVNNDLLLNNVKVRDKVDFGDYNLSYDNVKTTHRADLELSRHEFSNFREFVAVGPTPENDVEVVIVEENYLSDYYPFVITESLSSLSFSITGEIKDIPSISDEINRDINGFSVSMKATIVYVDESNSEEIGRDISEFNVSMRQTVNYVDESNSEEIGRDITDFSVSMESVVVRNEVYTEDDDESINSLTFSITGTMSDV